MGTIEYLLQLSRKAEAQAEELRATIARIGDVPMRTGKDSVYGDLVESGRVAVTDEAHRNAWAACNRMIQQRREMGRLITDLKGEIEILTSIADDLIGTNGRLV